MRVIAIIATHNEEKLIGSCLENLRNQKCEFYIIDNDSTDSTVTIAESFRGKGLVDIERLPRNGVFDLHAQLKRKEELSRVLEADWLIHLDADEVCSPGPRFESLVDLFGEVTAQGYNAVNFQEYVFVPTQEEPDHYHTEFQYTMRYYYPFSPRFPHRLVAWRTQKHIKVDLITWAGHQVFFDGIKMFYENFPMYHYILLSLRHAIDKYVRRKYASSDIERGWSLDRINLKPESFKFPTRDDLRFYEGDESLDASNPWAQHFFS